MTNVLGRKLGLSTERGQNMSSGRDRCEVLKDVRHSDTGVGRTRASQPRLDRWRDL